MTTRKSSKRRAAPSRKRVRRASQTTAAQKGVLVLVSLCCVAIFLYPPWRDVWTNFEGFRLHAPLAYGFFWAPPPAVFPAPRTLDELRIGEEVLVVLAVGMVFYWILGRIPKR